MYYDRLLSGLREEKDFNIDESAYLAEIKIKSFDEFDRLISIISESNDEDIHEWQLFYRGVSSKDHELKSSIDWNGLIDSEADIINEFYAMAPEAFSGCRSDFEMVAKMQHYGLPTRFIDFTRNPYVALYFAAQKDEQNKQEEQSEQKERKEDDGAVYIVPGSDFCDRRFVDLIMRLSLGGLGDVEIQKFYELFSIPERRYLITQYLLCKKHLPFITPPYISERQRNQQSVFLMCLNQLYLRNAKNKTDRGILLNLDDIEMLKEAYALIGDYLPEKYIYIAHDEFCELKNENYNRQLMKIIIPAEVKRSILKHLSYRGISKEFIFPELENIATGIKTKYKERNTRR